jgi:hypothetical protein
VTTASAQEKDDSSVGLLTRHCSARTLKGRYGVTATGTIAGFGQVAFVGWADFDGVGNVTGADWASFNGAISFRNTTGTYEVNDNCTGTVTFASPTRDVEVHISLVLVDGGKEVLFIETDPGTC